MTVQSQKHKDGFILAILVIASLFANYSQSAVNVAIPTIGRELALSAIWQSWISTAFVLSSACLVVPLGKLSDIYGRKLLFLIGIIILTSGSILASFASSIAMLIAVRVYQGAGATIINLNTIAIASSVFPGTRRGRALGFIAASIYFGVSVGPFAGGLLTEWLGWQSVFWIAIPLGLLVIVLIYWKFEGEWKEPVKGKFDITGSTIFALSLICLTYGCTRLPEIYALVLVMLGLGGLGLFFIWESRVIEPVLPVKLFRNNPLFTYSSLAGLISYSATGVSLLISLYLQYVKGLSPFTAGLVMVIQPATQVIISVFAGRLSDKFQPRLLVSAGMLLDAMGLLFLGFLSSETSMASLLVTLFFMGIGFGLFSSPNTNAIMGAVEPRYYGAASVTQGTMRQIGFVVSMSVTTLVLALFVGQAEITISNRVQLLTALHYAFFISCALCSIGIYFSAARGKMNRGIKATAD